MPLVGPPESYPLGYFKNRSFLPRYALCRRCLQGWQEWRARCTQRFRRTGVVSCLRKSKEHEENITVGRVDKYFCESVGLIKGWPKHGGNCAKNSFGIQRFVPEGEEENAFRVHRDEKNDLLFIADENSVQLVAKL